MFPPERATLSSHRYLLWAGWLPLLISLWIAAPCPAWGDVELIVSPPQITVNPGDVFTVELSIPVAMSAFNGYDAVLGYDGTLLRLLSEASSADREGKLMTDACPTIRWNQFVVSPDSTTISIAHVLLCAGVTVTGPGVVYRLRFAAKSQLAVTSLQLLEGTAFYDAGEFVEPVVTGDAQIRIDQGTDAPAPYSPPTRLRAVPNPFNPSTVFAFSVARPGPASLRIVGVDGRLVRELDLGWLEEGPQTVPWDGTDQRGVRLASGRYLAHLRHRTGEASCGAVLLK